MAGLLRTRVRSPAGRELFLLLCVGVCERQSNGKILLDHYRHKRRRSAGDERVCHQPVTAMRLPTARPKSAGCGTGPPARLSFPISARSTCVAPTRRSQDLTLTRSAQRTTVKGRCRRERSETALRVVPRSLKRQAPAPLGGKDAPKPDKVIACLATPLHNFPGRESFLPGRHFAQERHGTNRHGRCDAAAASCGQVCRRPVFPEYATARKRTALKRLRQNFGRQPCPPIRWLTKLRAARSSGPGIHY